MIETLQKRNGPLLFSLFAGASLAVHGAMVAFATFPGEPLELSSPQVAERAKDYHFTCWSDASLTYGARALRCQLPGSEASCIRGARDDFRFDLLVCDGLRDTEESEPVVFMSEEELSALEPEPLLDVAPMDDIEAAKLLEEEIREKKKEAEKRISNPTPSGQIVEVTPPEVEVDPERARFLSEYATAVDKESVARGSTEKMVERPEAPELPVDPNRKPLPEEVEPAAKEPADSATASNATAAGSREQDSQLNSQLNAARMAMRTQMPQRESSAGVSEGVETSAEDGIAAKKGEGAVDRRAVEGRAGSAGDAAAGGTRAKIPDLRPSQDALARLAGGGSVDKLDGVASGDFTALNAKKWKFASFFNRMKRQVAQNWHPDRVYLRRDPTGKVYGSKDRVTVLEVSLKPDGALAKVVVFKQSGIGFLDDEAVKAFRLAQPFPNPPDALVDGNSQLITFSFGFHFQIGSQSDAWKIFRYR